MQEFASSANLALAMYPGLTMGAIAALLEHGTEEQKQTFVPKMVEGVWSGTMNLTEPHCGTDLGLIKHEGRAQRRRLLRDHRHQDLHLGRRARLTENIIHLVLARIEGAPAGTKGISLFVVPKFT
jgi:acyl-CoA dehydrogenase